MKPSFTLRALPSDTPSLTLRETIERTGLSADTLRYYERMGLLRPIARDAHRRHRRYSEQDCCDLAFVQILRETAMPLLLIRELISLLRKPEDTTQQRLALLLAHEQSVEARLSQMQANLTAIQQKIERCQKDIAQRKHHDEDRNSN